MIAQIDAPALLQDREDISGIGDVLQRIRIQDDQIGHLVFLEAAELIAAVQKLSRKGSGADSQRGLAIMRYGAS